MMLHFDPAADPPETASIGNYYFQLTGTYSISSKILFNFYIIIYTEIIADLTQITNDREKNKIRY